MVLRLGAGLEMVPLPVPPPTLQVPPPVLEQYFSADGHRFRLVERIRDKVEVFRHNVMTAQEYPAADLILCRNVLIYFTRPEQDRILARFAASLPEGGALVLGRSETLIGQVRRLYRTEFPVERIYRRAAGAADGRGLVPGR
mgnify:CR=1 FL=1